MLAALTPTGVAGAAEPETATPEADPDPRGTLATPWYVGQPLVQVSLEAPEGGLPRENLEPLLRARQGERVHIADVRHDIALLYRAGSFAAVEVVAEPWFTVGEDGEVEDAVRLTYKVWPPPRVADLQIVGARGAARRAVQRGLRLREGEPLYGEEDEEAARLAALAALRGAGFADARVEVRVDRAAPNDPRVLVAVEPGAAGRYGAILLSGDIVGQDDCSRVGHLLHPDRCGLREGELRRWLRRAGVAKRRRVTAESYEEARRTVSDALVSRGWLESRVTTFIPPFDAATGEASLTLNVEGGRRLVIDADGRPGVRQDRLPSRGALREVLGLYQGDRVTETSAAEARLRLLEWYDHKGYTAAEVDISVASDEDIHRLRLRVEPGRRRVLDQVRAEGAVTFTERYLGLALREAAPETLGDNVLSEGDLTKAMGALGEFYRGQGFLSARLRLGERTLGRPRWTPLHPLQVVQPVDLRIVVEEGPRTTLSELRCEGGTGLEDALIATAGAELVGGPYQPARLDSLARDLVALYRSEGYLNADAAVRVEQVTESEGAPGEAGRGEPSGPSARALLRLNPGSPVRLRSVVVRGNTRTARRVIEREVALTVGEPITPEGVADTRSRLYALDLFRTVSPELVGEDDRARDLLLVLEEKPTLLFEAGGGVSTDQGVQLNARAAHRNLGGLGHTVNLIGQAGLGWEGDRWLLNVDAPTYKAAIRYEAPWVLGRGFRLSVEGLLGERVQEPTFRFSRTGAAVGLRYTRSRRFDVFADYRLQARRIEDIDPGALVLGDPWLGPLHVERLDDLSGIALPSDRRVVTGPEVVLVYDGRDDRFNPRRGAFISGIFSVSDSLITDPLYLRGQLRLERFVPLGPVVLDLVGDLGAGWSPGISDTLPIEDRFYLGGGSSLRGFAVNSVGPANYIGRPEIGFPDEVGPIVGGTSLRDRSAHWVTTGGDSVLASTVEVRVPFPTLGLSGFDNTALATFMDLGHVGFLDSFVTADSALATETTVADPFFRWSVGAGLRISTPIGPAALDLGFNLDPLPGRDEAWILPHLSLGEL